MRLRWLCRRLSSSRLSIEPRDGRVATRRSLDLQSGRDAAPQPLERELAVLVLRSPFGRRRPNDRTEPLEQTSPLPRSEGRRPGHVEADFGARVRRVRVLAPRSPGRREPPLELVERDDTRAADPQPVHVRRLDSGQTGSVRLGFRMIVAIVVTCVLAFTLAACGGDDDSGAGPAPTNQDPGPNDTTDAPVTIQGTARLDPTAGCIVLETSNGRFALQFTDYKLGRRRRTRDRSRPTTVGCSPTTATRSS